MIYPLIFPISHDLPSFVPCIFSNFCKVVQGGLPEELKTAMDGHGAAASDLEVNPSVQE